MKQTRRIINWLVACSLAVVMVSSAAAAGAKERSGKVVRLKGAARYSTGNNVWQPVRVGTILHEGALVQTAAGSYVDVILGESVITPVRAIAGGSVGAGGGSYHPRAEQDIVRIKEDTVLAFDKLSVTDTGGEKITDTQLDLRSGRILGTVKKLSPTSRYEIKLPNGVAGIRGTIYLISADGLVQVVTGTVVISWVAPDGTTKTETVNAGNQFDPRTGLVTPIPQEILQPLIDEIGGLPPGIATPPETVTVDNTIYHVSPSTANNGGQGGGGGEGESQGGL